MIKTLRLLALPVAAAFSLALSAEQYQVNRIDRMPALPQPYLMRDWKQVTRDYVDLVLNGDASGSYLPLSRLGNSGKNYPDSRPLYLDTYVGWNAHGAGSEAINAMPAVVSACLTDCDGGSAYGNLADAVVDFFNSANGQNVYLNGFSSYSGSDWWYDLMPNVYFYQLYHLGRFSNRERAAQQYASVADRWLEAVHALGGSTYEWTLPSMSYRAFNLATMKPLASGVNEPESAGTIAYLLFDAWLSTGEARYLAGAEMAMEYLSRLGSNPAYELQLAYGVQTAAKMNAMLGTNYRTSKLFGNCFDRGYLRGWGSIVGTWGGYDVSGLIGEANDAGNDYAFVMNGFQQVAALAPAVRYDKRLARAYGRWVLNVANASRLFYPGFMPDANCEPASLAWAKAYDPAACIPYESMKQNYAGHSPYAMGDAVGGNWAATNLSLYSGSSVGYMAAVVATTNVEAILQLDLTATEFDNQAKYPTYLYYNPYTAEKTVELPLPSGDYQIYDAIGEQRFGGTFSGKAAFAVPADGVVMAVVIPASASLVKRDNRLYAGDVVVDWHTDYDFEPRLRVKNVEAADPFPVKDTTLELNAVVDAYFSPATYTWAIDGSTVSGASSAKVAVPLTGLALGEHTATVTAACGEATASASAKFTILAEAISAPVVSSVTADVSNLSVLPGAVVTVTAALADPTQPADIVWTASAGTLQTDGLSATWTLPQTEGAFKIECTASNLRGSSRGETTVLARSDGGVAAPALVYLPFDGDTTCRESGLTLQAGSGTSVKYDAGHRGQALTLSGGYLYFPENPASLQPEDEVTVSFWLAPSQVVVNEMFVVSHGSWQNRFKVSLTPEQKVRWTIRTQFATVDVDCPEAVVKGRMNHYCAVYTGYSAEIYRDGQLVAYQPVSGSIMTTSYPITVGAMHTDDLSYNLYGTVDELRIYGRALTPAQVEELYRTDMLGIEGVEVERDGAPAVWFDASGRLVCCEADARIVSVCSPSGRVYPARGTFGGGIWFVSVARGQNLYTVKLIR